MRFRGVETRVEADSNGIVLVVLVTNVQFDQE